MAMSEKEKRKKLREAAKKAKEEQIKELENIIKTKDIVIPGKSKREITSKEYRTFISEVRRKPKGIFEKLCSFSEKHLVSITPTGKGADKMQSEIETAYLNVTPTGVVTFSLWIFLFFVAVTFVSLLLNLGIFTFFMFLFAAGVGYYSYSYPGYKARAVTMRMSSDSVLAILYMIIYMRTSPNLEGALKFAAENLKGPLALDLKKLLWDIEVGVYSSADQALADYTERWKDRNKEFSESLNLLRGTAVSPARREKLFKEILNTILTGTAERTKKYVYGLRMPILLIHAMGILLPVMGLVMFPIIVIFMADSVKPIFLFMGYDVLLPLSIWFLIDYILKSRPATFSQPDISLVRDISPMGTMVFVGKDVPIWPFSVLLVLVLLGLSFFPAIPCFTEGVNCASSLMTVSMMIILALSSGIILFTYLDSKGKMEIRGTIEQIESEFSTALFQLGNEISGGSPIETASDNVADGLKGMKIGQLFKDTSSNMRRFGYTFEQALFDKRSGSVWNYPSRLIRSIMSTLVQSSKKGMKAASDAMVTISRYLKGVHEVKESTEDILGETLTSMRFLAAFLTPMVAGLTVTMATIIIQILTQLGEQFSSLSLDQGAGQLSVVQFGFLGGGMEGGLPVGPAGFQLIVGLYMLETVILLAYFVNRIEYGDDAIGLRSTMYKTVLIAVFVYFVSWFLTTALFGDPITQLLTPDLNAG